jgi:hypothetical protein
VGTDASSFDCGERVLSVVAIDAAYIDARGADMFTEPPLPRPFGAWTTAEQIDAERAVFGERVYREVRLRQGYEACDPPRMRKHVPHGVGHRR